jgi:FtsZ-binding cell division protein ZapB
VSFSQLPAVKKDTKNCAPGNFFGPSYFVTTLVDKIWLLTFFFIREINLNPFFLSDEYERAVATVNQLTQQIEDLKEATRDDSETVDTLKRKLETSLRDNDRMSKQNKDLGKIIDFFYPLYFMIYQICLNKIENDFQGNVIIQFETIL